MCQAPGKIFLCTLGSPAAVCRQCSNVSHLLTSAQNSFVSPQPPQAWASVLLDPPWQGELPGGSLAGWLSPPGCCPGWLNRVCARQIVGGATAQHLTQPTHAEHPPHNPCHNALGTPSQMPGTQQLPVGTEGKAAERMGYKLCLKKQKKMMILCADGYFNLGSGILEITVIAHSL